MLGISISRPFLTHSLDKATLRMSGHRNPLVCYASIGQLDFGELFICQESPFSLTPFVPHPAKVLSHMYAAWFTFFWPRPYVIHIHICMYFLLSQSSSKPNHTNHVANHHHSTPKQAAHHSHHSKSNHSSSKGGNGNHAQHSKPNHNSGRLSQHPDESPSGHKASFDDERRGPLQIT